MKITGARAVAVILQRLGINHIWGIPGAKTLSVYQEIQENGIHATLVTNELSASFMADGYYRVSGKPGVCISIPGPGMTNMLTGIAEAFLDSSALLVITVNPRKNRHRFNIHEVPQLEIVRPVVKKVMEISSISQINELFMAYRFSSQDEPGPVVVEIGSQVMNQEIDESALVYNDSPTPVSINPEAVSKIVECIREAKQVGIYAGKGCLGAGRELLEISKLLSAPIATTISGRGVVPEDYALATGYGFGRTGSPAAYSVFKKCDLILAIGVKFSEMATGGWGLKFNKMIHIDSAKDNLDKNYSSVFSVQADAQIILQELHKSLADRQHAVNGNMTEEIRRNKKEYAAKIEKKHGCGAIHPAKLLRELRKCLPRDAILSTDVGYHQLWSLSDYDVFEPGTYLTPADYQAMGFGIPASMGAAMATPDKKVVCICGDGGFLISGFELLTAVREKLNLSVFIFNDGALGLIKGLQKTLYNRNVSVDLNNPDFEQLANSFGVRYFQIAEEANLKDKMETILAHKGVNFVECKITYDEFPLYIKGNIRNTWDQMPLSQKLSLFYRYVKCRL